MEDDPLSTRSRPGQHQHPLLWRVGSDLHLEQQARANTANEQGAPQLQQNFTREQQLQVAYRVLAQRRKLPPVLNSRGALSTLAATFDDAGGDQPPSQRIGTHLSPGPICSSAAVVPPHDRGTAAASSAMLHALLNSSKPQQHPPPQHQQLPQSLAAAVSEAATVDALLRYSFYCSAFGIDDAAVAPFKPAWLQAALQRVPAMPPPYVSQAAYEEVLAASSEELLQDYSSSMKKAILTYVLVSPSEQQRLGLTALAPLLSCQQPDVQPGSSSSSRGGVPRRRLACSPCLPASHEELVRRQLPPEWRQHVAQARDGIVWSLQTLSPNALELSRQWHEAGWAAARLLDVASPDLLVPAFRAHQQAVTEGVRGQLWGNWMPRCLDVFWRLPPVPVNNDAARFFACVATLQSNQLRQLVADSLADYCSFFRLRYATAHLGAAAAPPEVVASSSSAAAAAAATVGSLASSCLHGPLFEVQLLAPAPGGGDVLFQPRLEEAAAAVLSAAEAAVLATAGLPRISAQAIASSSVAAPPGLTVGAVSEGAIPSTGLQDQLVSDACQELACIVAANAEPARRLAALFRPHLPLLQLDAAAHAQSFMAAGSASSPDLLQAVAAEVQRLRSAAREVEALCPDSVRAAPGGMFLVHTAALKAQLAGAAAAASCALLEAVAAAARDSSAAIAAECAEAAAALGRPSASGEQALAKRKAVGRFMLAAEWLREQAAANRAREELLFRFRLPLSEPDGDAARRALEGQRRLDLLLQEAGGKAGAELRGFEAALRAQRRELEARLDGLAARVAAAAAVAAAGGGGGAGGAPPPAATAGGSGRGDASSAAARREAAAAAAAELQADLAAAQDAAAGINTQEQVFGWPASGSYSARLAELTARLLDCKAVRV